MALTEMCPDFRVTIRSTVTQTGYQLRSHVAGSPVKHNKLVTGLTFCVEKAARQFLSITYIPHYFIALEKTYLYSQCAKVWIPLSNLKRQKHLLGDFHANLSNSLMWRLWKQCNNTFIVIVMELQDRCTIKSFCNCNYNHHLPKTRIS